MAAPTLFKNGGLHMASSTQGTTYTQVAGVKSVEMPLSKAELANGVMSDNVEVFFPGLVSAPITATLRQDFIGTATGNDAEFWTRWNSETKFRLGVLPVNAVVSATNPRYTFTAVGVFSITPISGAHGVLLEQQVTFRCLSGCALSRDVASSS